MQDSGLCCPACGYNLTALTSSTCPECGKRFVLEAAGAPRGHDRWLPRLLLIGAIVMSLASLMVFSDVRGPMTGNSADGAASGLWIAFAIIHVWGKARL